MVLSPMALLVLSATALALGILLAWWGRRGKTIDDHPVCRKCRFDLVGRPPGSERCPECGADLGRRRAIAVGNRGPRQFLIITGVCIAFLAVCSLGGLGWTRLNHLQEADKPTWLVLVDSRSDNEDFRLSALSELADRLKNDQLSESQRKAYFDRLSEMLGSTGPDAQNDALNLLSDAGPAAGPAMPALVAKLGSREYPPFPKNVGGMSAYAPSTFGESAAYLLKGLGPPGQQAMLEKVRAGSPPVLMNWLNLCREVDDERIARLILEALNSRDTELSSRASIALFNWRTPFPFQPAMDGLHDPHRNVRAACLRLLGRLDRRPSLDVLLPFLHDPDPSISLSAQDALASCYFWTSDTRAQPLLIELVTNPACKCRSAAAAALGHYKTEESTHALALAMKDKDQDVYRSATYSLGAIGGDAAVNAIIDVLDDLPLNRRASAESLADQLSQGTYKEMPYWQKHEAAKQVGTKARSSDLQDAQP